MICLMRFFSMRTKDTQSEKLKGLSLKVLNFCHAMSKFSFVVQSFVILGDSMIYLPMSTAKSCLLVLTRAVVTASSIT